MAQLGVIACVYLVHIVCRMATPCVHCVCVCVSVVHVCCSGSFERCAGPETRNPKPETRNPKPETRNPKRETAKGKGLVCMAAAGVGFAARAEAGLYVLLDLSPWLAPPKGFQGLGFRV
jgi:hypothetical protein